MEDVILCNCVIIFYINVRMRSAQDHMLNADDEEDKGHDIVAANSSWHKRVLLLQVCIVWE
jgi:hypothetical protein